MFPDVLDCPYTSSWRVHICLLLRSCALKHAHSIMGVFSFRTYGKAGSSLAVETYQEDAHLFSDHRFQTCLTGEGAFDQLLRSECFVHPWKHLEKDL